jgi:nucleoside-diphosphate-sugar epimerase
MTSSGKRQRVLVTGAAGFIAGHCAAELAAHGYEVRGTVRPSSQDPKVEGIATIVRADLASDEGWAEAVSGCDYVLHAASPFPLEHPADPDVLVRPAVDGTLRVLRAAAGSGTVRRMVLTSSVAAIRPPGRRFPRPLTEDDWADPDSSDAYQRSKTRAERAAWDFVKDTPQLELAVINPGMTFGPVQRAGGRLSTSLEPVRRLLAREVPGVPRLGSNVVDVRDLAIAHRLAMELPAAAGNRYICAGPHLWMSDMAAILARKYQVPRRPVPFWLLWLIGRFDPVVRRVLPDIGRSVEVSTDKARRELGWTMRPADETVLDTAASLIEHGFVAT